MSSEDSQFTLTRYAPTPSGYLHIGNVLSFVLTAAIAKRSNARIILRIDDLDQERVRDEYIQDVFDTLSFLQLPYHEGPRNIEEFKSSWSQIHRLHLYNDALEKLASSKLVFACNCTRSLLQQASGYPQNCLNAGIPLDAPDTCWRLITQESTGVSLKAWPNGTHRVSLSADMQNAVVRKKDGYPAYQLASVIDDVHYKVDLIVRGEDLWPSTVVQLHMAQQLKAYDLVETTFLHHPLIMGADGNKLSKSMGDTSIKYLRDNGYAAADVFTLIGNVLGWTRPISDWELLGELLYNKLYA